MAWNGAKRRAMKAFGQTNMAEMDATGLETLYALTVDEEEFLLCTGGHEVNSVMDISRIAST
jgi:N-acetylglutamate synthase-like GNAT family acetyltransferase